jgi:hypothetical protein
MFIGDDCWKIFFLAVRGETLAFCTVHFAPLERGRSLRALVYKHFAALRRGQPLLVEDEKTALDKIQRQIPRMHLSI